MAIKNFIKDVALGKMQSWQTQLASFDYCQLELEYAYKKSGNTQNSIESESVKVIHEKDNNVDPNALAVYAYNVKVGYIPMHMQSEFNSLKHIEQLNLRFYFYNDLYRAELLATYRAR